MSLLENCDRIRNTEALVYCCGTIKNITNGSDLQSRLVDSGAVHALSAILTDLLADPPTPGTDLARDSDSLLLQMTAALRNLSVQGDHRRVFLSSNLVALLAELLRTNAQNHALMLNVSRIFSKLTLHSDCRAALAQCPSAVADLHDVCVRHRQRKPLAVRLLFTLGNLTATDPDNRRKLFEVSSGGSSLLDLLEYFSREFLGNAELSKGKSPEDSENALVKLIRVVANLCIDPDIGSIFCVASTCCHPGCLTSWRVFCAALPGVLHCATYRFRSWQWRALLASLADTTHALAVAPCRAGKCDIIVELLKVKDVNESLELVLNLVSAINNLSFCSVDGSVILRQRMAVSELLVPLLLNDNIEVVIEVGRVFGNFSQAKEVRDLLMQKRAHELLVVFLEHGNKEVVYTVCGVLMNLMKDPDYRSLVPASGAVDSLLDVLVHAASRDWQLAGLVGKTLWNYSECVAAPGSDVEATFGVEMAAELVELLAEMLDEPEFAPEDGDPAGWKK